MSTKPRIGVLVGSHLPPNEENVLLSLGKMLKDRFDLDLIANCVNWQVPSPPRRYYSIQDYSGSTILLRKLPLLREVLISCYILCKYIKEFKPDVLFHITKPQTYGLAIALVGKCFRIPFVARNGGNILYAHKLKSGLVKWYMFVRVACLAHVTFRLAPVIITIGENLTQDLVHLGISRKKIRTIPQPIDRERFHPPVNLDEKRRYKETLKLPPDKDAVLFVGRMTKLERVDIMPHIVEQVLARSDRFIFLFVGKISPYAKQIEKLGGNSVRFVGEISHQQIPQFYKAADLLIHISGGEGSVPNSVLEALACNLPVCANRVGAIESVTANVFDTAEEFAKFILSRNWCRDSIPDRFEWNSLKHRYIECFAGLLNS